MADNESDEKTKGLGGMEREYVPDDDRKVSDALEAETVMITPKLELMRLGVLVGLGQERAEQILQAGLIDGTRKLDHMDGHVLVDSLKSAAVFMERIREIGCDALKEAGLDHLIRDGMIPIPIRCDGSDGSKPGGLPN